ncbi:hypothetical protein [Kamptonema sp. UHCC 0994]|uniref:hypothetical protein n=1 Tax=Kamptonema sp. UHCC 0994 TaxID=3031329 RepID=UPI0023BA18C2|nr:hypothetical protein [Kamptonema sp. UHCC 0994]MDF0556055.1 hypothetical protein [Kamptonema sp. UHCC 0994]
MSVERWDDDRLDRLANTVESIGDQMSAFGDRMKAFDIRMDALGAKLEVTASIADSNARVIQALANVAAEAREERQQLFERMERHEAKMEGLRIETARMLDILLNQRNQGDNPTA